MSSIKTNVSDKLVLQKLNCLPKKLKLVLTLRYGLDNNPPVSAAKCALLLAKAGFGFCDTTEPVSRERIKQLEDLAFKKLKLHFNKTTIPD